MAKAAIMLGVLVVLLSLSWFMLDIARRDGVRVGSEFLCTCIYWGAVTCCALGGLLLFGAFL